MCDRDFCLRLERQPAGAKPPHFALLREESPLSAYRSLRGDGCREKRAKRAPTARMRIGLCKLPAVEGELAAADKIQVMNALGALAHIVYNSDKVVRVKLQGANSFRGHIVKSDFNCALTAQSCGKHSSTAQEINIFERDIAAVGDGCLELCIIFNTCGALVLAELTA